MLRPAQSLRAGTLLCHVLVLICALAWSHIALAASPYRSGNKENGFYQTFHHVSGGGQGQNGHEQQPVHATADHVQFTNQGTYRFTGNVHIEKGDKILNAAKVFYNRQTGLVRIPAYGSYRTPYYKVSGKNGDYNLNEKWGGFEQARYHFLQRQGRGSAGSVRIKDPEHDLLRNATYTTCPPSHVDWLLNASKIYLDRENQQGTAYNVVLHFMGVPVLYSPIFAFPLTDNRKTGFLVPTVGYTSDTGFDLTTPYYLNLAPNYDATLLPRIASRRGPMLGSQVRLKTQGSYSTFFGNYLPYDMDTHSHDLRYRLDFNSLARFTDHIGFMADYNRVSDDQYFEDLGSTLEAESTDELLQRAQLFYQQGNWLTLGAKVEGYQNLKPPIFKSATYDRLPELSLHGQTPFALYGFGLDLDGTYTYFHKENALQGTRMDWQPAIYWKHDQGGYFLNGRTTYERTDYRLFHTSSSQRANPSRSIPIYEATAGLRFVRAAGQGLMQTLEPKLYYLYVPYRDQTNLPVFDTFGPNFTSNDVFTRTGFWGKDRIENANRITAGFSTRLSSMETGKQILKFTLAQVYRFNRPQVGVIRPENHQLTSYIPNSGLSDTVAELDYRISDAWSTKLASHYDQYLDKVVGNDFSLRYLAPGQAVLNLGYHYSFRRSEQTNISFDLPLADHWDLLGRWDYSLHTDTTVQILGGLAYHNCCYAVRLAYRYYLDTQRLDRLNFEDAEKKQAVFVQFQFKGLAAIGSQLTNLLRRDIVGYTPQ